MKLLLVDLVLFCSLIARNILTAQQLNFTQVDLARSSYMTVPP